MTMRGPDAPYQIADLLVTAVNTALPDPVDRACVVPGGIVWDDCQCGMLAGSINRIYLTDQFPDEATISPCPGAFYAVDIALELARCVPIAGDGNTISPACVDLAASAAVLYSDEWYLITTVDCTLGDLEDAGEIVGFLTRPVTTIGPLGDCVGSRIIATVQIHRGKNP